MSLGNLLARVVVEIVRVAAVAYVASRAGMSEAELLERLAQSRGRSRSRSGAPVVWLQRVPKEGVRA